MMCLLFAALAAGFQVARPVWPAGSEGLPNENVRFAAAFEADGRPLVLRATGATQYKIKLDGETVGWGPARAPEGWARVSEIPLKVGSGRHELAFEVMAYNVKQLYCNIPQPGYLQAELADADGKVLAATGKDGAFKATPISARHRVTARFSCQRGFVECWTQPERSEAALPLAERPAKRYAIRRAPEPNLSVLTPFVLVGEQKVRFNPDASSQDWFFVKDEYEQIELGYPLTNHVWDAYRHSQKFVALEKFRPVQASANSRLAEGLRLRYDLGADLTGFVGLKVKVLKPGKLWLNWSELLVGGKVNSFKMRNADVSVWEFTEKGEYAIETIEPYTLRYLEATAEEGIFELSSPALRRLESPELAAAKLPPMPDAELDLVLAAARSTLAQNTLDTFMDCPGRERAAWLGDSFFSAKGAFALTGNVKVEKDFLENWLLPESFGDLPEGMLPMTYPSSATTGRFIPNWAMWYVLQLEDYLKRSGDRAFVDAMKPRMMKLVKFFRQYRNADGLLEKLPSWVFIEWSAANEYVQDVNYPANMHWAGVLESIGRMYGDAEATAEAAQVRKAVFAQSFDGQFFRDHAKRWADGSLTVMPECTETCQDYALFFRLGDKDTPGDWYRTVLDKLGGARPYGSDVLPEVSKSAPFIGDALRLLALSELGETETLVRDLKAFFVPQAQRTGTLWETEKEIHSNCHGFAGAAADILLRLADRQRERGVRSAVTVDFTKEEGAIRPLHGVNNGPTLVTTNATARQEDFARAHIPFMRTHDTIGRWGGTHYVDIPNVFPDFDADENDPKSYDFTFTDAYLAPFVRAGTEIFYRLGVGLETHWQMKRYTTNPPKDFAKWARICEHVVRHYNEGWADGYRWNIRYWEVWNEPDNPSMWSGTSTEFIELYAITAKHLKRCFPALKVGGYGSCGFYGLNHSERRGAAGAEWGFYADFIRWYDELLARCARKDDPVPLDFFSFHLYTEDPREHKLHADYAQKKLNEHGLAATELINDEWNAISLADDWSGRGVAEAFGKETHASAAYIAAVLSVMQRETTLSKAMFYCARPQDGGFGTLFHANKKPTTAFEALVAFDALYGLGTSVGVTSDCRDVYALAAKDAKGRQRVLITNFTDRERTVDLKFGTGADYAVSRIDAEHAKLTPTGEAVKDGGAVVIPWKGVVLLDRKGFDSVKEN